MGLATNDVRKHLGEAQKKVVSEDRDETMHPATRPFCRPDTTVAYPPRSTSNVGALAVCECKSFCAIKATNLSTDMEISHTFPEIDK